MRPAARMTCSIAKASAPSVPGKAANACRPPPPSRGGWDRRRSWGRPSRTANIGAHAAPKSMDCAPDIRSTSRQWCAGRSRASILAHQLKGHCPALLPTVSGSTSVASMLSTMRKGKVRRSASRFRVLALQNRSRAVVAADRVETIGDIGKRRVPLDRLEAAGAFRPDPLQGTRQANARIAPDAVITNRTFAAQRAPADAVRGIANHDDRAIGRKSSPPRRRHRSNPAGRWCGSCWRPSSRPPAFTPGRKPDRRMRRGSCAALRHSSGRARSGCCRAREHRPSCSGTGPSDPGGPADLGHLIGRNRRSVAVQDLQRHDVERVKDPEAHFQRGVVERILARPDFVEIRRMLVR